MTAALRTREAEARQAQAELQRQREAFYQAQELADMGSRLAGVAHELNNPLAVVMGRAGLLNQALTEGPLADQAEKITKAADRCVRIVRNFLALARQYPPERSEVLANQVVREAVELLAYPLRVDNVEVIFDLAESVRMSSRSVSRSRSADKRMPIALRSLSCLLIWRASISTRAHSHASRSTVANVSGETDGLRYA
jgi:signal transduction histidine kinase